MANPFSRLGGYLRMIFAFLGIIFLLAGISLQFFSAGNLYGIRLTDLCLAHAGTKDLSDAPSFQIVINTVLSKRAECLNMADPQQKAKCCSVYSGLCTRPEIKDLSQYDEMPAQEKMALLTSVIGLFLGVRSPGGYDSANPEFWCKNCPNDWRMNCPFDPVDDNETLAGFQVDKVCQCPGGKVSSKGEAFWATISDNTLSSRYILCSDKADVYEAWIQAMFPTWDRSQLDHARQRFEAKCWQAKGGTGYILSIGPVLALFTGIFSIASLFKRLANSPVPSIGFNLGMIAAALEFVAFWAITFTGAAGLVSRYAFCAGFQYPIVQNASFSSTSRVRAAPVLYNDAPCFDRNSEGQFRNNPFIEELAYYNGAYVSGGVLVILSIICMLAITSKVADVVMEQKLAGEENKQQMDD